MHKLLARISLFICITTACQSVNNKEKVPQLKRLSIPTGIYVGLEEMRGFPAEKPGDKWYHENYVYIRPDSLFLEGNPIVISSKGAKGYSASDGGFYSYSGRIDTIKGKFVAKLLMFAHDYIAAPIRVKAEDTAAIRNMDLEEAIRRGLASRDSSFYKRTSIIIPTVAGFDMDSVHYVPATPDSSLGLPGFPDAKRFFKQLKH
jgi:hypothetical protein